MQQQQPLQQPQQALSAATTTAATTSQQGQCMTVNSTEEPVYSGASSAAGVSLGTATKAQSCPMQDQQQPLGTGEVSAGSTSQPEAPANTSANASAQTASTTGGSSSESTTTPKNPFMDSKTKSVPPATKPSSVKLNARVGAPLPPPPRASLSSKVLSPRKRDVATERVVPERSLSEPCAIFAASVDAFNATHTVDENPQEQQQQQQQSLESSPLTSSLTLSPQRSKSAGNEAALPPPPLTPQQPEPAPAVVAPTSQPNSIASGPPVALDMISPHAASLPNSPMERLGVSDRTPPQQQMDPASFSKAPALPILDKAPSSDEVKSKEQGVLLGLEALERQQAELEKKQAELAERKAAAAAAQQQQIRMQAQAAPHMYLSQTPNMVSATPGLEYRHNMAVPGHFPAYYGSSTDGTAPSSTTTSRACGQPPKQEKIVKRSASFGKFLLRTPIKAKQRIGGSWHGERHGDTVGEHNRNHDIRPETMHQRRTDSVDTVILSPLPDDQQDEADMWQGQPVKPLVYGYLEKLGRNGSWQRRFFETDGECLTYFKSRKRIKLLASLDLCKVGEISVDNTDPTGCTFTIEVADRPYYLKAESNACCNDWVISLNRVREARVQIGRLELVTPQFHHDNNDRNRSESDEYVAPRVVMVANRERTRAANMEEMESQINSLNESRPDPVLVSEDEDWQQEQMNSPDSTLTGTMNGAVQRHQVSSPRLLPKLAPVVLARWEKRRTNIQKMRVRAVRWAKRVRVVGYCVGREDDVIVMPAHAARAHAHQSAMYGLNQNQSGHGGFDGGFDQHQAQFGPQVGTQGFGSQAGNQNNGRQIGFQGYGPHVGTQSIGPQVGNQGFILPPAGSNVHAGAQSYGPLTGIQGFGQNSKTSETIEEESMSGSVSQSSTWTGTGKEQGQMSVGSGEHDPMEGSVRSGVSGVSGLSCMSGISTVKVPSGRISPAAVATGHDNDDDYRRSSRQFA
uniref:PH domain-containing protein n=1 Tax=Ditylum brightwellii TaxID=49249 RepID=A0A7S1ZRW4_9STRA|mmetsp:Transcript_37685/g.56389  ORF Transcript_37685/g.56389 Transcript_37685/m.56389 type:complete len:969 (+) Transcript_37685:130-3036(+)